LLYKQGKYGEAEPLYRRSLAIMEAKLGAEHPSVATGLNNLAGLLITQNKFVEAESMLRRAFEIRELKLGKEHPDTISTKEALDLLHLLNELSEKMK